MYHTLIRDDELGQYRRITEEDRDRLVVCPDGDLYRVVRDAAPNICLLVEGEVLCDFPAPHLHTYRIQAGDADAALYDPRRDIATGISR